MATDDGSVGRRGTVVDLARRAWSGAAGERARLRPRPDARRGAGLDGRGRAVDGYASLEAHMACGTGACHGCVVATRRGYLRVCVEGPCSRWELLGD